MNHRACHPSAAGVAVACDEFRRVEVASYGFDPALCGLTFDGPLAQHVRVPPLASSSIQTSYLFQLCTYPLPTRGHVWLVGLAQLLELGLDTNGGTPPVYPLTKLVGRSGSGNPNWRFPDAMVSWHVRRVRNVPSIDWSVQNVLSCSSFAWRWSTSPALVFETATFPLANVDGRGHPDNYLSLTAYTAPNGGQPQGESVADLGTFYDIRFPWDNPSRQAIDPIRVEGDGSSALVVYARVWQTNANTRAKVTVPAGMPLDPQLPEDAFVAAFTAGAPTQVNSPIYWGVGARLVIDRG